MSSYETERQKYRPKTVKLLLITESPPPDASIASSRHFYRTDQQRTGDRLFTNTIKALYPEAEPLTEAQLQADKQVWLRRFQKDGCFMLEALQDSQEHEVSKRERQMRIKAGLPDLLRRVTAVADKHAKIILVKSNVFEVAAEPLRQAGFSVLNTDLVDYPGRFNQANYRRKLADLVRSM